MTIEIRQFFEVFFDEAEELLAEMEQLLLAIDPATAQKEQIDAIFRTAHSIKGGAATFGLSDITELTHGLESMLDDWRVDACVITGAHVDVFLATKDVLAMLVQCHRHGGDVDHVALAGVQARLTGLARIAAPSAGPGQSSATAAPHCWRIALPALAAPAAAALCAELGLMGSVACIDAVAGAHAADNAATILTLTTTCMADAIRDVCSFLVDPADVLITAQAVPHAHALAVAIAEEGDGYGFFAPFTRFAPALDATPALPEHPEQAAQKRQPPAHESASIRVSIEKVDQLINLVGELVITQAMLEQRCTERDAMAHERLLNGVSQLTRNTRDLQQAVMSMRMMPMEFVFSRFPRMVRDLAGTLGKEVDFITDGAATELDKGLIERIVDPLTHLVRNSIDHGIETPAQRLAAGKPARGTLTLGALHQGGHIQITVRDDGGGLNRERILDTARCQGMVLAPNLPDADVWRLIFAAGFSTAETISEVSGRGVGMDVVRRNVSAMGGTIEIHSVTGRGTTVTISLPLTLAILDGMSIRVGAEIYILPLANVIESLQPVPDDVRQVAGHGQVLKVRGEYLPLIALHRSFDVVPRFTEPAQGIVVIVEAEGKKAGMFIDELVGQQQVVVKNLESNYRKVAGISGATILGDGAVSLIVDVAAMLRGLSAASPAGLAGLDK
jgi:two-component system chemotaxis sensor kinase CheA